MNIALVSPECFPYTLATELSYIVYSLSKGLEKQGNNVKVILPRYGSIDPQEFYIERLPAECKFSFQGKSVLAVTYKGILPASLVNVYLIDNQNYFSNSKEVYLGHDEDSKRFDYFCSGALSVIKLLKTSPDIIHAFDPYASYTACLIKEEFNYRILENAGYVFTLCNELALQKGFYKDVKEAVNYADWVTTPSKYFAEELIQSLSLKKERHTGILSNLDPELFNPATDPDTPQNFSRDYFSAGKKKCKEEIIRTLGLEGDIRKPLFSMFVYPEENKNLNFIETSILNIADLSLELVICVLNKEQEIKLKRMTKEIRNVQIVYCSNFFDCKKILAGSDFYISPAKSDPMGQYILMAMKYGNIPIAFNTGAVKDISSKLDNSFNFFFEEYKQEALIKQIHNALVSYKNRGIWPGYVKKAMNFGYELDSCKEYLKLYEDILSTKLNKTVLQPG